MNARCEVHGALVAVSASVGITMVPSEGGEVDALLEQTDFALYAAKAGGGGELRVFEPQMAATTRRRQRVEQALRHALERGELSLTFQPQVDLLESRVIGFESLLRWHHAELGEVPPAEFIPVAEDAGLIPQSVNGCWFKPAERPLGGPPR